ncbi:MAG: hypothetical protein ACXVCV_05575 [Polyangia bacterium]
MTLPQALDGALWADPAVYATLPLRITVGDGSAESVSVAIGGMGRRAPRQRHRRSQARALLRDRLVLT